jgi:hypothetical protein
VTSLALGLANNAKEGNYVSLAALGLASNAKEGNYVSLLEPPFL